MPKAEQVAAVMRCAGRVWIADPKRDADEFMAWIGGHSDKWWALRALAETNEQETETETDER